MSVKCLLSANTMLFLNLSHPAVRGLRGCSAALSCCPLLLPQKHCDQTRADSFRNTFRSSSFITHTHVQSKLFASKQLNRSNRFYTSSLLPVSSKCYHQDLMRVNSVLWKQAAAIHHQQPDGDKQAQQVFILSPKGLFNASPESWKPYLSLMRLDRPIGKLWMLSKSIYIIN